MLPDDPDSQARLFYLVILGSVFVVWAFAQYRHRLGQAAQHAAIWALIFIGAVLAVGFAEPLQRQLFQSGTLQIDGQTVALERGRDGHFHANLEINGQSVRMMVDTGATSVVLSKRDAERIGIDTANLSYGLTAQTANGTVQIAPVRLDEVRLGDFVDQRVRATVNGGQMGQSLLGMSYLDRFSRVEVSGDRMLLSR